MSQAPPPPDDPRIADADPPDDPRIRNPYAPDDLPPASVPDGPRRLGPPHDEGGQRELAGTGDARGGSDPWMVRAGVAVAIGLGLGILAAAALGFAGSSGQVGAVVVLLLLSLGTTVGALLALVSAVVDEFRGRDVAWRRPVLGVVLFFAAAVLMTMTVAAAA